MYFVIVKEIASGKIVDKAELSGTRNIEGELAHIAWLTRKQFENKYPSDKYLISYQEADSFEKLFLKLNEQTDWTNNQPESGEVFTMIGSRFLLFMTSVGAMIGGTILLFILLVIRLIYDPFLFILFIMVFFFYLFFDHRRWTKKGIHMIKIDKEGFTIYRGNDMQPTRVDKKQITGINVFKKLNRRIVNILLGGYSDNSLPGVTLFSGPRIRITDDAFSNAEFEIFIKNLRELKK